MHIWYLNLSDFKDKVRDFYSLLSDDEKEKASKFRFIKDRHQFVLSRGSLRILTSRYLKKPNDDIVFSYGEFGKPEYHFKSDLKFNVSHSENMAVVGFVKHHDIGVDIENTKGDFDVLDIAQNYFSKREISALKSLPKSEHVNGFYRCWTRKESFIKAKSKGLSFPLDQFSVSLTSEQHVALLETHWDETEAKLWRLFSFSPKTNYIGAVSVKATNPVIKYFDFTELEYC